MLIEIVPLATPLKAQWDASESRNYGLKNKREASQPILHMFELNEGGQVELWGGATPRQEDPLQFP